jgi:hypothetical protein
MNNHNTIQKTIESEEVFFVKFTEDEMKQLGIEIHDKFEVESNKETGTLTLKKFAKLDIDLNEFDKKTLTMLIEKSIEEQTPVDDIIRKVLESYLKENKKD